MTPEHETLTLEELFQEELDAVLSMAAALEDMMQDIPAHDPEYTLMQQELIKLNITATYFDDRLNNRVPNRWLRED